MAQATLAKTFPGRFDKILVPCVVASGDIQDRKGTEPLSFRCGGPHLGGGGWSKVTLPLLLRPRDRGVGPGLGVRLGAGAQGHQHALPAHPAPTTPCSWSCGARRWLRPSL